MDLLLRSALTAVARHYINKSLQVMTFNRRLQILFYFIKFNALYCDRSITEFEHICRLRGHFPAAVNLST